MCCDVVDLPPKECWEHTELLPSSADTVSRPLQFLMLPHGKFLMLPLPQQARGGRKGGRERAAVLGSAACRG